MRTKIYSIIVDVINLILLYFVIIGAGSILELSVGMGMIAYDYIANAVVIVAFFFIKEFTTKLWIYIVCNLVVFVGTVSLAPEFNAGVRVGFVIFIFMIFNAFSWGARNRQSAAQIPWGLFIVFVVASAYASRVGDDGLIASRMFVFTVLFIGLEIVKRVLKSAYELSISGQFTSDMPIKEIYRNCFIVSSVIMLISIGLMVFVRSQRLIGLLYGILQKIEYAILYVFVKLLLMSSVVEPEQANRLIAPDIDNVVGGGVIDQLLEIVGALIMFGVFVIVAIAMLRAIRNVFIEYGHRDRRKRIDRRFVSGNETRERIVIAKDRRRHMPFTAKDNLEKIRYQYRKKLMTYKARGVSVSDKNTPTENEVLVREKTSEEIETITRIYEKARYGMDMPKDEDVIAMKNAIKMIN